MSANNNATETITTKSQLELETNDAHKSYREKELGMRDEYYRSNPLRLYVSSIKGKTILPPNFAYNKKKLLPKIYSDLRETDDFSADRSVHKEKMRAHLKLSLNSLDQLDPSKNTIDLLDHSKKVYTDYSRLNLSKPIDLKKVESVVKSLMRQEERVKSAQSSLNSSSLTNLNTNSQEFRYNKANVDKLEIDAQNLPIKNFDEFSKELRNRKFLLAKSSSLNPNFSAKYDFKNARSNLNKSTPNLHRGSIYNYRQAKLRQSAEKYEYEEQQETPELNLNYYSYTPNFQSNSLSVKETSSELDNKPSGSSKPVLVSNVIDQERKYQQRIQLAREKILSEACEKTNLNKMTILHPFEDTKILINIDKVPSKILNNLLNKQTRAPRYFMPATRAFGYFRKVIAASSSESSLLLLQQQKSAATPRGELMSSKRSQASAGKDLLSQNAKYESLKSLSESKSLFVFRSAANNDGFKSSNERNKGIPT